MKIDRNSIYGIIEPRNKLKTFSKLYDVLMVVAIVASITPLAFRHQERWMALLDRVSCSIFILDYLLRWLCADKFGRKSRISFFLYPLRPMAIIDLLSILPSLTILNTAFKLFRVTRLFKILRVVKVFRYYVPLQIMIRVIRKESMTLMTVFAFAVFYILITALIMFNVETTIDPSTGENVFENIFDAIYWSACTLTTVGYGDICPVSNIGRFFCILSSLIGVAIIALPSGVITAAYLDEIRNCKTKEGTGTGLCTVEYQ